MECKKMKRQNCINCIAFNEYRYYCMLGNSVVITMEKVYLDEFKKFVDMPKIYPVSKCNKPKTKKDFCLFIKDINYKKNFEVKE